jgi:hypothetical protein
MQRERQIDVLTRAVERAKRVIAAVLSTAGMRDQLHRNHEFARQLRKQRETSQTPDRQV